MTPDGETAFPLTPHEVRAQPFARAVRGYERADVDAFRERVAGELERLLRERAQLDERLRAAQEMLRTYRERERALNDALVAAQQLRADTREQAEREAEAILREARAEAGRLVQRAQQDERQVRDRADLAARQFAAYVATVRGALERQIAELDGLAELARRPPLGPAARGED